MSIKIKKHTLFVCLLFSFFISSVAQAQDHEIKPVRVVASFSLLADMVQQVGGDLVDVEAIVGPDEDAHDFQPTPQDAKKLVDADIIVINGLGFEGYITRMVQASKSRAKLLIATAGIKPRLMSRKEDEKAAHSFDPHAWQNLDNAPIYIRNIAAALIEARPEQEKEIKARARRYLDACKSLHEEAKTRFAQLSPQRRTAITSHDAFGYFADAYNLTFMGAVGVSEESEPSAADIARLIDQIKQEKVHALFVENMNDPRLIQQISQETNVKIGGKLYADALSQPQGPAPDYLSLMRTNITTVLGALGE